jgi:1-acyl-sn-glycerol-3-phosphate acyltransferase
MAIALTFWFFLTDRLAAVFPEIFWAIPIFIVAFVAVALFWVVFFCLSLYVLESVDSKRVWKHRFYLMFGMYGLSYLLRVKLVISGKDNIPDHNHFVVYSNHIEYVDPVYIKHAFNNKPLAFVAKKSLFRFPCLRQLLIGAGCIRLKRGMDREALQSVLKTIKAVKNGQPMGVFPEGTRSHKDDVAPFKPGSFKIAMKAKADIVPVSLYHMHGIFKKGRIKIHKAYLDILRPIPHEEYKDMTTQEISDMVRESIIKKQKAHQEIAS